MCPEDIQINTGWTTTGLAGADLTTMAPSDEFLHPVDKNAGYAASETSYFSFSVPERELMGWIYFWFHPKLNMMSAGILIFTGKNQSPLASDYARYYHFLPMPDSIGYLEIPELGLEMKVLEPLKRIRMIHRDPDRDVSFKLLFEGAFPPVGRPNGSHFTQIMRATGTICLYDDSMTVDSFFFRDHSWEPARSESPMNLPPISWMTGMAGDDFAFSAVAFDDPASKPDWLGSFDHITSDNHFMWGFVQRNGEFESITSVDKLTYRGDDGVSPIAYDLVLHTKKNRPVKLKGEVVAQAPWHPWNNMVAWFNLTRWKSEDRGFWGDTQDIQHNRYVHLYSR